MKLNKAFTLIEVMVVISIVAVLASMILIAVQNAKQRALEGKVQTDIDEITTALESYHLANNSYPIIPGLTGATTAAGGGWDILQSALSQYINLPYPPYISATSAGRFLSGYVYYHSPQSGTGVRIPIYDRTTSSYIKCVWLYDAYYISAEFPNDYVPPTANNDSGLDPDAFDKLSLFGKYEIRPMSDCPSGVYTFSY